jgi:uncharacterized protein YkwD
MRRISGLCVFLLIGSCGVVSAEATTGLTAPAVDGVTRAVIGRDTCATASASPAPSNLRATSAAILCLLNAERAAHGLPSLRSNRALRKASQRMANLMVAKRFFGHETPDGRTVVDRVRPTGYIHGGWSLGENIAWGSGALATPRAIVDDWMHSPGHRANILRAKFKDIGVGIKLGAPGLGLAGGATYVTDFGRHS